MMSKVQRATRDLRADEPIISSHSSHLEAAAGQGGDVGVEGNNPAKVL
jgi:hypothetical protein